MSIRIANRWLASLAERDFKNKIDNDLFLGKYQLLSAEHRKELATIDWPCFNFVNNKRIIVLGLWWACGEKDWKYLVRYGFQNKNT